MTREDFIAKWRARYAELRPSQPPSVFLNFYWEEIYADMEPFIEEAAKQYYKELLTNLVSVKEFSQGDRKI